MSWKTDLSLDAMFLRVIHGDRALCMQPYDEINKKRGTQWEAARLLTIASNDPANNAYSVILTGDKPVDLKSRVLGHTGIGVVGRIYKNPTYTGGTMDPFYNMLSSMSGAAPEAQLLVGITLTDTGTEIGAPIFSIGPDSQQGKGHTPSEFGSNRILDELNTAYLLEIASIDPQSQQVTARIEIYEGGLDTPNEDYP